MLYDQGLDAVDALIVEMQSTIERLTTRVEELEVRLGKDSHNSSKPPSIDGLARRKPKPRSLRKSQGRSPGGQVGRVGRTLQPVEKPDVTLLHRPDTCAACWHSLEGAQVVAAERRQVFDLPVLRLQVTEHRALRCVCSHCHALTQGVFPDQVRKPVQYGSGLLGLSVYLSQYHLLPLARTQQLLADMFDQGPCQGTLETALGQAHQRLAPVIKVSLWQAPVAHFDETGVHVNKRLQWLHIAANSALTFYQCHPNRGRAAHIDIGILPTYRGHSVHDALSSYLCPDYLCTHGLCNAHLLRELLSLWEATRQTWTQRLCTL